ncbi:hypothetical protein TNCV_570661 [Trichonephila clavipes]|nr:hypothetical protein TNCV_570661 [Trichonephila clavipes]
MLQPIYDYQENGNQAIDVDAITLKGLRKCNYEWRHDELISFTTEKRRFFDKEDKKREGRLERFEDADVEALLKEESCQMQEFAESLGTTQQAILLRIKGTGRVPYELKPKERGKEIFL